MAGVIIASAVVEAEGTSLETAVDVLMHPIEEVGRRQQARAAIAGPMAVRLYMALMPQCMVVHPVVLLIPQQRMVARPMVLPTPQQRMVARPMAVMADRMAARLMVVANITRRKVRNLATCRIGIGGRVAPPPLPHHRTCGSASGGSAD